MLMWLLWNSSCSTTSGAMSGTWRGSGRSMGTTDRDWRPKCESTHDCCHHLFLSSMPPYPPPPLLSTTSTTMFFECIQTKANTETLFILDNSTFTIWCVSYYERVTYFNIFSSSWVFFVIFFFFFNLKIKFKAVFSFVLVSKLKK